MSLLDQLHVASEPAADLESVGSTDPMLVDSDTASLDAFPTNVVVYDEPLPRADSGGSTIMEVLVISHGEHSGGGGQDPLQAVMQDLTAPIPEDADTEKLEARRVQLVESANRLASMRRLSEAYQREMHVPSAARRLLVGLAALAWSGSVARPSPACSGQIVPSTPRLRRTYELPRRQQTS